jgi:Fe-S-cluster-containing hydrogenase component 2
MPSAKRLAKGPVVVIECTEEIPCNPCEAMCEKGAITVGKPITNLPVFDGKKCGGCGLCLAPCPGQAIFLVDITQKEDELVSFPFEFLPLPSIGDRVIGLDREGRSVTEAVVERVSKVKRNDRTPIVTLRVPDGLAMMVRSMKRLEP